MVSSNDVAPITMFLNMTGALMYRIVVLYELYFVNIKITSHKLCGKNVLAGINIPNKLKDKHMTNLDGTVGTAVVGLGNLCLQDMQTSFRASVEDWSQSAGRLGFCLSRA